MNYPPPNNCQWAGGQLAARRGRRRSRSERIRRRARELSKLAFQRYVLDLERELQEGRLTLALVPLWRPPSYPHF